MQNDDMVLPGKSDSVVPTQSRTRNPIVPTIVVVAIIATATVMVMVHISATGESVKESNRLAVIGSMAECTGAISKEEENTRSELARIAAAQSSSLETVTEGLRTALTRELAHDASPAGSSAGVLPRQVAAGQRALELGNAAFQAGRPDEALLYFINGVNHDPSRFELVAKVASAALNSRDDALMERALGILELATVQVAPDDVPAVLAQMADLREKLAPPAPPTFTPIEAAQQIDAILKSNAPDAIWNNSEKINSALSEIDAFQQMVDLSLTGTNDDQFSDAIGKSIDLATKLQQIHVNLQLMQYVDTCLKQMSAVSAAPAPDLTLFASLSSAAQGVIAQSWGAIEKMPPGMRSRFTSFPKDIEALVAKVQQSSSAAPQLQAIAFIDKAMANKTGSQTSQINGVTKALEDAARKAEEINSPILRTELIQKMQSARIHLIALEVDRRAAYQTWAATSLNNFMLSWNAEKSVSDVDAQTFFVKYNIASIDESILVPEVGRILGRVMICMTGELNAGDGAKIEFRMASSKKKTLEDF